MTARRFLATVLCLAACTHLAAHSPAFAQPKPAAAKPAAPVDLVAKAQQLFDDQQYEESIQTLSAALVRPTNTKEQKVEIYRLLALNYITLGRKDEAENAVRGLLVVSPEYQMPPSESPRFRDFFAQARTKWEAEGRPGLVKDVPTEKIVVLKHGAPSQKEPGQTIDLRGKLDDPEGRVGSVKLHFRSGTKGPFEEAYAEIDGAMIHAQIPGSFVKPPVMDYYFELLDGGGGVIGSKGDAQNPLRIAVPEASKGWVLPVAIGGSIVGAAAIIGGLALAGVFKSSSSERGPSTVTINVGEAARW
jgi:hypothetical protein